MKLVKKSIFGSGVRDISRRAGDNECQFRKFLVNIEWS